jgi:hypothetical protein
MDFCATDGMTPPTLCPLNPNGICVGLNGGAFCIDPNNSQCAPGDLCSNCLAGTICVTFNAANGGVCCPGQRFGCMVPAPPP